MAIRNMDQITFDGDQVKFPASAILQEDLEGEITELNTHLNGFNDIVNADSNRLIIPCDDSTVVGGGNIKKNRTLLSVTGPTLIATYNRFCIHGTFAYSSSSPSYANRPTWYGTPCEKFVIGRLYRFSYKVLSGSIVKEGVGGDCYYDLRKQDGTTLQTASANGGLPLVWKCTFVPEMICFVIPKWTLTDVTIEMSIEDVTDEELVLPYYWKLYIDEKAKALAQASVPPIGNGTRFIFITDAHMRGADGTMHNAGFSPTLMKYLHDNANIGIAFFGGDAITGGYETQEDAIDDLMFFRKKFNPVWNWMYSIFGNHEYGNNSSSISALDKQIIYNALIRDKEHQYRAVSAGYGSYVIDNESEKIRYICMNLNEGSNLTQQNAFFCNAMLNTPSGWTILFFTHFSLTWDSATESFSIASKLTATNSIIPAIEAYNARQVYGSYDFTNAGAEVACVIGGHCHRDGMVKTTGGVPVIATSCDRSYGYEDVMIQGTVTEQCFDVVTIDTANKTIEMTRIGYGSDRSFTYGS